MWSPPRTTCRQRNLTLGDRSVAEPRFSGSAVASIETRRHGQSSSSTPPSAGKLSSDSSPPAGGSLRIPSPACCARRRQHFHAEGSMTSASSALTRRTDGDGTSAPMCPFSPGVTYRPSTQFRQFARSAQSHYAAFVRIDGASESTVNAGAGTDDALGVSADTGDMGPSSITFDPRPGVASIAADKGRCTIRCR
jgi:hypothetical protein